MELKFTKMHGLGNDYIYINCFDTVIESPETLAITLSDRHFGIGGDGIVLIMPSSIADAKMRMFNLDGSEGKMCGNAIRCVAKYLYDNTIVAKEELTIETLSGVKTLSLYIENGLVEKVKVDMGKAELIPEKIPVLLEGESIIASPITVGTENYEITCVSMGNPHCVVFCHDVDNVKLSAIGPLFEHNALFPDRINTEFIEVVERNRLKMRVWERGSGETLACGTGACASAVAAVLNGHCEKNSDIDVELLGGVLTIHYTDDTVFMTGSCTKVFEGTINI
ncbi:diaminopimelate epimerase [Metasolibacillus meyeri]|uniref:Diaminopimelate epimerase n=1 Tax=Metasolibacillus meyeri TaxID=1071052 RepID=A0AAW9NSV9_9BACL|nr:diaminopimelate epimerase [Metasolibacillus meyeri]MEC1179481.1 diaminopimelate epimerase [Metasolibacillus meyeri]